MLNPIQNLKLEEEKKKRLRNLDPWKIRYHPVPKDGQREGNQEEEQENQIQNFLLQQIHHLQQSPQPQPPSKKKKPSRLVGQIVPVHGGHIVRSTGRKDRHSKVCTAKGLRDRRVRLSAHTAIQFYDVQDRLGYDRPSKAVDWLIKNAKAAIDLLDELPPWQPSSSTDFQENQTFVGEPISTSTATSHINPSSYLPNLLSRTTSYAQDLRLSLQSFQDTTPNIFSGSAANLPFDSNSQFNPWNVADSMFGQNQSFPQREPLQSSNLSLMHTWSDQVDNSTGNQMHHPLFHLSPSVPDIGFGSSNVDFSGFRIPMRIQNKEEHDGDISDKQNSASASHY